MTDSNVSPESLDNQPGLFYDEDDVVMGNIRHCNNYPQDTLLSEAKDEMPMPPWRQQDATYGRGWFNINGLGNSKKDYTENNFCDFNHKACTNGNQKGWKYKWLLGSSEHSKNKPDEFSRKNWTFEDANKIWTPGSRTKDLWLTRNKNASVQVIARKSCNLSKKYYWGILDSHKFTDGYVKYDHGRNCKSNYIRAKGITFRYVVYHEETTKSLPNQNGTHGMVPFRWAALAYVGRKDDYIYLAELISNDKSEQTNDDNEHTKYPIYWNDRRKHTGRFRFVTDWNVNWKEEGGPGTASGPGGGPWDEFGIYAAKHHGYNKPAGYKNAGTDTWSGSSVCTGAASMTLSPTACRKIWDEDMVCVGLLVGSSNTSRTHGYVGSSMDFKMWDTKLMEQEFRGDNELPDKSDETARKFSILLRAPMTVKETQQLYKDLRDKKEFTYAPLDWINSKNPS